MTSTNTLNHIRRGGGKEVLTLTNLTSTLTQTLNYIRHDGGKEFSSAADELLRLALRTGSTARASPTSSSAAAGFFATRGSGFGAML